MRHKDRTITTIGDLLELLKKQHVKDQPTWYRGQSDEKWGLVPSVGREKKTQDMESALIKRFKQNALRFLDRRPH